MEEHQTYALCALLNRMKYISRWGLMRQHRAETLSEHTADTATLAHVLALIATEVYRRTDVRCETLAVAALYHDASEILTGDMPTPVKYKNEALKTAYKALERESAESLAKLAPPEISGALSGYLTGNVLSPAEHVLLKAADRLSALVKCLEEEAGGNTEFKSAKAQQLALLKGMHCPEADYFMRYLLPCYEKNLDDLTIQSFRR